MIWVIITVDEGGVLGVTQQLSQFGNGAFSMQTTPAVPVQNPFLSPRKVDSSPNPSLMSPNSSISAQQGSPYTSQLSPTATNETTTNYMARSLFMVCILTSLALIFTRLDAWLISSSHGDLL